MKQFRIGRSKIKLGKFRVGKVNPKKVGNFKNIGF